ncbi:MAG: protein kinase domain-containing protein [Candidatus Xenobia bacterium]
MEVSLPAGAPAAIGPWRVLGILGRGGFGTVYRVEHPQTGVVAALKWLHLIQARRDRLRFEREVEITSGLRHQNLVRMLGWGEFQGIPFSVMELVEGKTLREIIVARPIGTVTRDWRVRVHELGTPLFSVLQYIHNLTIVHRDIKPDNIYVAEDGVPRLGDFGLALAPSDVTRDSAAGTMAYMAPELFMGEEPDRRSDMYSLGILLMELILGHLPFAGPGEVKPLREFDPSLPEALEAVLARMTANSPESRYFAVSQACCDWLQALGQWTARLTHLSLPVESSTYDVVQPRFVGRSTEQAELRRVFNQAHRGSFQVVLVEGVAGSGKTRLVSRFVRSIVEHFRLLVGRAMEDRSTPYEALVAPLTEGLSTLPEDAPVDRTLLDRILPGFARRETSRSWSLQETPGSLRARIYEEIRRLLLWMARKETLVLVLEALQWADAPTQEALEYLTRASMDSPWRRPDQAPLEPVRLMVIATYRPEEVDSGSLLHRWLLASTLVTLEPMGSSDLEEMAQSALGLGEEPLPPQLAAVLEGESAGNPFFLIEVLNSLLHERVLTLEQSAWLWHEDAWQGWCGRLSRGDTPSSLERIRRVILRRMEGLPDAHRPVLWASAMVRGRFSYEELLEVCRSDSSDRVVLDAVDRLVSMRVLSEARTERGVWYAFANQKVQQFVLSDLSQTRRFALHRRWAEVLEKELEQGAADADLSGLTMRLLEHCEETQGWGLAARYVVEAAERAAAAGAWEEAWRLYRRVLQEERRQPALAADATLRPRAAQMAAFAGDAAEASALVQEMLSDARGAKRAPLAILLGRILFNVGEFAEASWWFEQALSALGLHVPGRGATGMVRAALGFAGTERLNRQHEDVLAEAANGLIHCNYFLADPSRANSTLYALGLLRQVANMTRRNDLLAMAHLYQCYLGVLSCPPWVGMVDGHIQKGLHYATESGDPRLQMEVYRDLVYTCMLIGRTQDAERFIQMGASLAQRVVDVTHLCWFAELDGFIGMLMGDLQAREATLRQGLEYARVLRHRYLTWANRLLLVRLLGFLGRLEEARELLMHPSDCEIDSPFTRMIDDIDTGLLLFWNGQYDEAEAMLRAAGEQVLHRSAGAFWVLLAGHFQALSMCALGNARGARPLLRRMAKAAGKIPFLQAFLHPVQAEVAAREGDPGRATEFDARAQKACQTTGCRTLGAWALELAAERTPEGYARAAAAWTKVGAADRGAQVAGRKRAL